MTPLVHDTAVVHRDVTLHPSVQIGPYCVIGSDHGPLHLGAGSIVRSHTIIEGANTVGDRLETGHHTLIRAGNEIGTNLRIGTQSRLEGGAAIGDFVRIHGNCEMTKGTMRDFSRIYAGTIIADNLLPPSRVNVHAVMDEGAVACLNCVILAGVRVGVGAFVGAGITVSRDVPDATALVGRTLKPVSELSWQGYSYPWTGVYREYPEDAQARLERLHQRILAVLAA